MLPMVSMTSEKSVKTKTGSEYAQYPEVCRTVRKESFEAQFDNAALVSQLASSLAIAKLRKM